jgi:hypothetical protein
MSCFCTKPRVVLVIFLFTFLPGKMVVLKFYFAFFSLVYDFYGGEQKLAETGVRSCVLPLIIGLDFSAETGVRSCVLPLIIGLDFSDRGLYSWLCSYLTFALRLRMSYGLSINFERLSIGCHRLGFGAKGNTWHPIW